MMSAWKQSDHLKYKALLLTMFRFELITMDEWKEMLYTSCENVVMNFDMFGRGN